MFVTFILYQEYLVKVYLLDQIMNSQHQLMLHSVDSRSQEICQI